MQIGESGKVRIGQQVLAIGNPFGFDHTLTTGALAFMAAVIKFKIRILTITIYCWLHPVVNHRMSLGLCTAYSLTTCCASRRCIGYVVSMQENLTVFSEQLSIQAKACCAACVHRLLSCAHL